MDKTEAVRRVQNGLTVECSAAEYRDNIREALQNHAAKCLDQKDNIRAQIALSEVQRLDLKFKYRIGSSFPEGEQLPSGKKLNWDQQG